MRTTLIVHERIARWTRRLRPRSEGWGARLVESRSLDDLAASAAATACPIVVVDAAGRLRAALDAILSVRQVAPAALVLAIDDAVDSGFPAAAREAGATLALRGSSPSPVVFDLIGRWVEVARGRSEADGWAADRCAEPEPWESLLAD